MVKQEWKSLWRNKILMIVLVFIIAIPAIYTTLFLGSMWDPYGKLDELPVEKSENYGFHHCKAVGTDVGDDRLHERGCGLSRGEFL